MADKTDFRANEAKQATRIANLEAALRSAFLAPTHLGKLTCDWAELAGRGAPSIDVVLPYMDTTQARFIGVERDASVLGDCEEREGVTFIHGELQDVLRFERERLCDVGVLNYDSFDSPGAPLKRTLKLLHEFAVEQRRSLGHFLLIVNVAVQQTKTTDSAVAWVTQHFRGTFAGACMPSDIRECVYVSRMRPMINVPVGYGFDPLD